MSRSRIVVAAVGDRPEGDDPTLDVSHSHLRAGDEVVHLGGGLDAESVARTAVAEDAERVVLVGADDAALSAVRSVLADLDAGEVVVESA